MASEEPALVFNIVFERILTSRDSSRSRPASAVKPRSLFSAAIRERASTSAYADPRPRYRARTRGRTASPSPWEIDLSGRKPENRGRRIYAPGIASGSRRKMPQESLWEMRRGNYYRLPLMVTDATVCTLATMETPRTNLDFILKRRNFDDKSRSGRKKKNGKTVNRRN